MSEREESDQLPEEGPGSQVPQDEPGPARGEAEKNRGGADDSADDQEGQATGNPDAAGG